MHHKRGRDYQACNVGWLWKQQHVYTVGQNDSNFTGVRQIVKYGDSQAVGFVTDRYRFSWVTMPRFRLPDSRWVMWRRRATANRFGTTSTLNAPQLTFVPHLELYSNSSPSSIRFGTFSWTSEIANQTSQVSDTFSAEYPTAQTVAISQMALTLLNLGTEVVMVKL